MKIVNIILTFVIFLILVSLVVANPNEPSIDEKVTQKLNAGETPDVVIKFKENSVNPNLLLSDLESSSLNDITTGPKGKWIIGKLSKEGLKKLENNPNIEKIFIPKVRSTFLKETKAIVNAKEVWDYGFKGSGKSVCVIDSGIDTDHKAFSGRILAERCYCRLNEGNNNDCCPDGTSSQTGSGSAEDNGQSSHGTHVSGIVAADRLIEGIAKKANIIAVKVCNSTGGCNTADVALGIDWCRQNKDTYDISAISISLGSEEEHYSSISDCPNTDLDVVEVNDAYNDNLAVIIASGNEDNLTSISSPACASGAISVGSSKKSDKSVSSFTNRGEILDILAPGENVLSTINSFPYYDSKSGTSMSTPVVSGAVALLSEADETNSVTNSPMHIRELLKETGKPIYDQYSQLWIPRLDIFKAFQLDWPFYHHDMRRTGFTILKGDMQENKKQELTWDGDKALNNSFYDYPSIADIDGDGRQELITSTSMTVGGIEDALYGKLFVLECISFGFNRCLDFWKKWSLEGNDLVIARAPSIDDLDGDGRNDIVFATLPNNGGDGKVYAFDTRERGTLSLSDAKWTYKLPSEEDQDPLLPGEVLHTAIVDIDNDGKKEVLVADYGGIINWQGYLYVLRHNGAQKQRIAIGTYNVSGGVQGAIAAANIDSTDYPEIIVPSSYGLYVYNYTPSTQQLGVKWNNSDAEIFGTPVVADVDADNKYEIVYLTRNDDCDVGSCSNQLHIVDAETGSTDGSQPTLTDYPIGDPAVANLDSDKYLEIVIMTRNDLTSSSSYGYIYSYDGNAHTVQNSFPSTNDVDTKYAAADIADIDKDGTNDVIFTISNGTVFFLNNQLSSKWQAYNLGGTLASAPALGDLDGDGKLEIVAKHYTSNTAGMVLDALTYKKELNTTLQGILGTADSVLTLIGGNNTQPDLDYIDDLYVIEGDLVNITPSASDYDGDSLSFSFSSPLNTSDDNLTGFWQTDENSTGEYEVLVEASDSNLSDSQFVILTVFENGTLLENNFSDGNNSKELTYNSAGNQTVFVDVPDDVNISRAAVRVHGLSLTSQNNSFQEPKPVVIEANELNSSEASNLSVDKDWDTYYSAGKATGEIVEIEDLSIPGNKKHIIYHLKLRVYGGGTGRFAAYNYNTDTYEIVTSSILPFSEMSRDIFFELYEDNPLWATNETAFSMKVDDLDDYTSGNKTRWYYRYLGDWASQMIYESDVKFEEDIIFPQSLTLDVGNDSTADFELQGKLHDREATVNQFNNSNFNETISLGAYQNATRYFILPKDADLESAIISLGDKNVETLAMETETSELKKAKTEKRGVSFNSYANGDGTRTAVLYTQPINYFNGLEYVPIETKIVPSAESDYEVTKGIYKAYFKEDSASKETVKVEKDNAFITYSPVKISYSNDIGSAEAINNVQSVNGKSTDNTFKYEGLFGPGIDLKYEYTTSRLKEEVIIDDISSLPKPGISEGYLDVEFEVNSNADIYVDGEKWDRKTRVETKNIELRDNEESVLILSRPYADDAEGKKESLKHELREEAGKLYITVKTPYSFLENAAYPVTIDPSTGTVTRTQSAGLEQASPDSPHEDPTPAYHQTQNSNRNVRFAMEFDLSDLNASNLTYVRLQMHCETPQNPVSGKTDTDIWDIDTGWDKYTVTWNDPPFLYNYINSSYCNTANTGHTWDVTTDSIENFATSNLLAFEAISKTESYDATTRYVEYTNNASLYVNYIPNEAPVLVGCPNAYTEKNSDGSDISIDLWDCHYDYESADYNTFSILSESNTTLIDCNITSDRYVLCDAPLANATGYSDVSVQVSDGQYTDNDTMRIYVKDKGNVSVYINETQVYKGDFWEYAELDLLSDINNFLDTCTEDSDGNCQVPLKMESYDDAIDFSVNWFNIKYNLYEVDFKDALQSYIDNSCSTSTCTVPLTFGLNGEGLLNLTDLQVFYRDSLYINSISASPDPQGLGEDVAISASIDGDIDTVLVGITPPGGSETNYTMTNTSSSDWSYTYNTFTNGSHPYTVYVNTTTNLSKAETSSFETYSTLAIHVQTKKDSYGADEFVKLWYESYAPVVNDVTVSPSQQGLGEDIDFIVNVTDQNGQGDIDSVWVNISSPGGSSGIYYLTTTDNLIWSYYGFTDYSNGTYSYVVYAEDSEGEQDSYSGSFEMFSTMEISLQTKQDSYVLGELVELNGAANVAPSIDSLQDSPDPQGLGEDVSITAVVTDANHPSDLDSVWIGITPPGESAANYSMTNTGGWVWNKVFSDYTNGTYSYTVYANDSYNNVTTSSGSFELYDNLILSISTLKDSYGSDEFVNLTEVS